MWIRNKILYKIFELQDTCITERISMNIDISSIKEATIVSQGTVEVLLYYNNEI